MILLHHLEGQYFFEKAYGPIFLITLYMKSCIAWSEQNETCRSVQPRGSEWYIGFYDDGI
ncbi:MAG: hypothetical protein IPM38_05785 [Ignavibacteria bacterium]|nr:hypothetical protein [Ignavibacteria bacterium]